MRLRLRSSLPLLLAVASSSVSAATLFTNLPAFPGNVGVNSTSNNEYYAKSFVPTAGGSVTSITIWAQRVTGFTGNFTMAIYSDNAGQPGTRLGTSNLTNAPTSSAQVTATFATPVNLAVGTRYWAVFYGDWAVWLNIDTTAEASPFVKYSNNAGTSWVNASGGVGNSQYRLGLTVTGNPVNTAPSSANDAYSTLEDTALTVNAPGVLANDSDPEGDTLQAIVVTPPATGTLTLNANGAFTYVPAANTNGTVTFTYRTWDGALNAPTNATVTLTITPVNDAPSFTKGPDVTVNEDSGAFSTAWATGISRGPTDENAQTLTFTTSVLSGAALFATPPAVSATGVLTFTPAANASGTAFVNVTLSDSGGTANGGLNTSAAQTFVITINPVNDAPSFAAADVTVLEDSGARTIAGWATGISAGANEAGQGLTFTATATDPTLFSVQPSVDPATGTLTFTPAPNASGATQVVVTLRDNGGTVSGGVDTFSRTLLFTVTGVNDAPSFTKGADVVVNEDTAFNAAWATNLSRGPANEAAQTLTFTLTNTNNALFSVQPALSATGVLTFTPAANASGTATVSVVLRDNGGTASGGVDTAATQTFLISVTGVNDAPAFTKGADVAVLEDAAAVTRAGWATGISAGPADEASQTLTFTLTNTNNALFSVQPALTSAGALTFTPAANASGTATVTVTLADSGGTANGGVNASAAQTFLITVTPVNDVPAFTKGANVTVAEDAAAYSAAWATGITVGPTNESTQVASFAVTAANTSLFSVQPAVSAAGVLTFTAAPNVSGTTNVTVVLSDNGGTANGGVDSAVAQTFTITIDPVNDAPAFTKGADVTVAEDSAAYTAAWATGISAGAPNESTQTLLFTVTAADPSLFSVQPAIGATGELTFTPAANASGTTTVTVTLADSGGTANGGVNTSASQTFTITISGINDPPFFVKGADVAVNEDAPAYAAAWATGITAGAAAESTQTISFTATAADPSLFSVQPAISASGELSFTPAANANGATVVTVVLRDNGGTANGGVDQSSAQTFTLTLNAVNDPPGFVKGADVTVQQNAAAYSEAMWATGISAGPANENAQTLLFSAVAANDTLFLVSPAIAVDGTLTFTPKQGASGSTTVEVTLSDNGGMANGGLDTSATQTFSITIVAPDAGVVADAGVDGGFITEDGGVIDTDGGVVDVDAGMGTGGGTGIGGGAGTGGGSGTGGGDAMGGGTGGGGDANQAPGCGCSGTEGSGLALLAMLGLALSSRRRR